MSNTEYKRNYETLNKFSFYVAGFLFVSLMGYQASLQKDQVSITRALAKTNADQQADISSIATSLESVITNQENLRSVVDSNHRGLRVTVEKVEHKIIIICAKLEVCD